MENGLRWIADVYNVAYTFTLCEGITPQELLVRIGAEPHHIHELSDSAVSELQFRPEDGHLSDLEFLDWEDEDLVARLTEAGFLTHPAVLVRAGAVPGWAYAIENSSDHATYHMEELSRGTQAYTVVRSGDGMQVVSYARDGRVVTAFEPGSGGVGGEPLEEIETLGFVCPDEGAGDVAFLRFLEREHGIYIAWEDAMAPLPTAAFARYP